MRTRIRFTAGDVIWKEKKKQVDDKLKDMLGLDVVDYSMPEVFQNRMRAIKIILDEMTPGEREDVKKKVENYKNTGLPPDIQRRLVIRHISKYCYSPLYFNSPLKSIRRASPLFRRALPISAVPCHLPAVPRR